MNPIDLLLAGLRGCTLVDLSTDVAEHADGPFRTEIEVLEPVPGARFFCENVLPAIAPQAVGRLTPEDFPDHAFLRHEMVHASVHAGSHVDSPGHYGPLADGSPGQVGSAPLEAFLGPGVLLDFSSVPGDQVLPAHLAKATRVSGVDSFRGTIPLLRTGGGKGISAEAIEILLDQEVRVIGTDAASFDGPFPPMVDRYLATGDSGELWPAHMLGRRRPYYQLERLRNLELLPVAGFVVIALPVLIGTATAAWTRALALTP
jgi:cyclase